MRGSCPLIRLRSVSGATFSREGRRDWAELKRTCLPGANSPATFCCFGAEQVLAMLLQGGQRAGFVVKHELGVADDICGQNGGEFALQDQSLMPLFIGPRRANLYATSV